MKASECFSGQALPSLGSLLITCVLVYCPASLLGFLFHSDAGPLIISEYWISDVTFNGFGV